MLALGNFDAGRSGDGQALEHDDVRALFGWARWAARFSSEVSFDVRLKEGWSICAREAYIPMSKAGSGQNA